MTWNTALFWIRLLLCAAGVIIVFAAPVFGSGTQLAFMLGALMAGLSVALLHRRHAPLLFFVSYSLILVFQHLGIAVLSRSSLDSSVFELQTAFKTVFVAVTLATVLVMAVYQRRCGSRTLLVELLVGVYILYLLLLFGVSRGPILLRGVYLRNFIDTSVVFVIGYYYFVSIEEGEQLLRFHGRLALVVACMGIALYWRNPMTNWFWESFVHLERFYHLRGYMHVEDIDRYAGGYLSSISSLFPTRAVSFFLDPIAYSYYLGFFILLIFAGVYRTSLITRMIVIFAFVLGGSKAAVLAVVLGLVPILLKRRAVIGKLYATSIAVVAPAVVILAFAHGFSTTRVHVNGLLHGLRYIALPFGHGLGSTGNLVKFLQTTAASSEAGNVTESIVGVLIYQAGLIGLVLFAAVGAAIVAAVYRSYETLAENSEVLAAASLACAGGLAGTLISALFSESALSPRAAAWYFLVAGFVVGAWQRRRAASVASGNGTRGTRMSTAGVARADVEGDA